MKARVNHAASLLVTSESSVVTAAHEPMLSPVLRLQPCGDFLIWTRLLSHCRRTHLKFIIWSYLPCLGGIFWAVSWRFLIGPEMFSHLQSPPAPDAQGSSGNWPTRGHQSLGAPIRPHPRPGTLKCGIRDGRGTGRLRKAHQLISQGTGRSFAVARGTGSASDTPPTSSRSSEAKREKSSPSPNQEKDRNVSLWKNFVDI